MLVLPGAGIIAPSLPRPSAARGQVCSVLISVPGPLLLYKARVWQHFVTFQQGSLLSLWSSASARCKGSVLLLQVSLSLLPGLKHREEGAEGGPLSVCTMTGGTIYMDSDEICASWVYAVGGTG